MRWPAAAGLHFECFFYGNRVILRRLLGARKMLESEKRFLVEWGDCDPAGIVFYPRYLEWFDACTTGLFATAGIPISTVFKAYGVIGAPLVDLKARFLVPSMFGDELLVRSGVQELRRSSFLIRHQFFKGETLAVEGIETRVWTGSDPSSPGRMKSRPLPAEVIERFSNPRGSAS
jgi:4-hydroxybenzoyl-CoA thioesterase